MVYLEVSVALLLVLFLENLPVFLIDGADDVATLQVHAPKRKNGLWSRFSLIQILLRKHFQTVDGKHFIKSRLYLDVLAHDFHSYRSTCVSVVLE